MGGFFRNIAPYASVFQGQQQGQAASNYAQQEVEQRKIQDQLNRALLMGKLQDMQAQQKALSGQPKDEQDFLNLGGTVKDWTSRQERTTKANSMADQMYQDAMDQSKSPQERMDLFQRSANLRAHPELIDLPENQKYGSGTTKPTTQPFRTFTADNKVQAFEGYGPDGKPIIQPMGASAASLKPPSETPVQKMEATPLGLLKGINVVSPDGSPWASTSDTYSEAIAKGGVPISDANQKVLAMNKAADDDLENLLGAGQAVLPGGDAGKLAKGMAPYKIGAEAFFGSPEASSFNASKIGLITHLRAVANASRVNQTELAQVNGALANAHSYPALQAAVEQARDMLMKARKNLVKAGKMNTDTGNSASADTSIGWSPDGREVMQRSDGSKYLK